MPRWGLAIKCSHLTVNYFNQRRTLSDATYLKNRYGAKRAGFQTGGAGLCDTSCQTLPAVMGLMMVAVAGWGQRGLGHIKGERNPPLMGCTRCSPRKLPFVTPPFSSAVRPSTPMTLTSYKPRYKLSIEITLLSSCTWTKRESDSVLCNEHKATAKHGNHIFPAAFFHDGHCNVS